MAYGAVPNTTATSSRRPQVAATVLLLAAGLCATALVAFKAPLPTSGKVSDADLNARAAASLAQYADTISDISAWTEKRDASKKGAIALPETEKTDQNTCLNKVLASLMEKHETKSYKMKKAIGDAYIAEDTGKDDYANARHEEALKDERYLPVASTAALAEVVVHFMNANEMVEAYKWAEEPGLANDRDAMLLKPSENQLAAAHTFVEQTKVNFKNVVMKCYVTDCAPGKGFEGSATTGGKCHACVTGETWSDETDALPCAHVIASCPAGQGYSHSTSKLADASCHSCPHGEFSDAEDTHGCSAHSHTTCPAGEELHEGSAHADSSCHPCAHGHFKAGDGAHACTAITAHSCSAGHEAVAGTASSDGSCEACTAGHFSAGGYAACAPHDAALTCGVGSEPVAGTAHHDRTCGPCAAGHFSAHDSTTACTAFSTHDCPAHQVLEEGDATEDSACEACPEGKIKEAAGPEICVKAACMPDKIESPEVAVFNFPGLNGGGIGDQSDENSNLLSIIQKENDKKDTGRGIRGRGIRSKRAGEKIDGVFPDGAFALIGGQTGKFCAAEGDKIVCNRDHIGEWEQFHIEEVAGTEHSPATKYNIKAHSGYCHDNMWAGDLVVCDQDSGHGEFQLTIINKEEQIVALHAVNAIKYCADEGEAGIKCNRESIGAWEQFIVIDASPPGKYKINDGITSFTLSDLEHRLNSAVFFFMTDMERQDPNSESFLPATARHIMKEWVTGGGVLLMTGTYGGHDTNFMNNIFGWDLTTAGSSGTWHMNAANAVGTSFEGGPASVDGPSATDAIGLGSVAGAMPIYGTNSNAAVAILPFDDGMIIFLGFDYYAAGFATNWGKGTHTDGHQRGNAWVGEILPRALKYAAAIGCK